MPRLRLTVLVALLFVLGSGIARGAPILQSPTEPGLMLGVSLSDQLDDNLPGWSARSEQVNAQLVRLQVDWASVAPTSRPAGFQASDPASPYYDWLAVDHQVENLTSDGLTVIITVIDAPGWAEAPGHGTDGVWKPSAVDFGDFAHAIATRYDGRFSNPFDPGQALPRVRYWQAWNEPNILLSPAWVRSGGEWIDNAARLYRPMLDDFYAAVKSVSNTDIVLMAGTAPFGSAPGSGVNRVAPITFDQDLFCLSAENRPAPHCPQKAEFDILDHHPYTSGQDRYGPNWRPSVRADVSVSNMTSLIAVLDAAERAHTVLPAGRKPVWVTEIGWQTDPPQPTGDGVSLGDQALFASQSLYLLWRQGVSAVCWFQLGDQPAVAGSTVPAYFTEGLFFADGAPKPAARAFAFPFLVISASSGRARLWGRAPRTGTLDLQVRSHSAWQTAGQLQVSAGEVFEVSIPRTAALIARAAVDGVTSVTASVTQPNSV